MKKPFFFLLFLACAVSAQARDFSIPADTITSLTCPPSISVNLTGTNCDSLLYYTVGYSSEDPSAVLVQTQGLASGSAFPAGTTTNVFQYRLSDDTLTCSFTVSVGSHNQEYYIRFPDDVILTNCPNPFNFGEPMVLNLGCEIINISYEDVIFTSPPDASIKIERTWTVINTLNFNPAQGLIYVPNPNPAPVANNPVNLVGPVVSPVQSIGDPWQSTIVKVVPTDPNPTNYSTFWDKNANGYKYKQVIKIIDSEDPVILNCAAQANLEIADLTGNDNKLWYSGAFWDNKVMSHDLADAPAELSIQAQDDCSGANVAVDYRLFLDLNGDETYETIIDSRYPSPSDSIYMGNNDGDADYFDGTPQAFDFRPVAAEQKYRFAIEQSVNGFVRTASLRWNTAANPQNYVLPQLPNGRCKIVWNVSDGSGNESICTSVVNIRDKKKPTVICLNGLSVNLMPTHLIQLWASDFLQYAEDNYSLGSQIKIGIRKSGTGTGFPLDVNGEPLESVVFTCDELGTQFVELWAMDADGNADYCETFVLVQDNIGVCGPNVGLIHGQVTTVSALPMEGVPIFVMGDHPALPPLIIGPTDANGSYHFDFPVPPGANYSIYPEKDDDLLNGVSAYDLYLISQHILGFTLLDSPYKLIAADANHSNSVTSFDIVELRRLILGIYTELPNNYSWRFIEKAFVFPNPANPFESPFPGSISSDNFADPNYSGDFLGVKIGDVDNSASPNAAQNEANQPPVPLLTENNYVEQGDIVELPFSYKKDIYGCQFTLEHKDMTLLAVLPGPALTEDNFGVFADHLTFANEKKGKYEFVLRFRVNKPGYLKDKLVLSSKTTANEAYLNAAGERQKMALNFIDLPEFGLLQNQPNPFSAETSISFNLPEDMEISLSVSDQNGKTLWEKTAPYSKGLNTETIQANQLPGQGLYTCSMRSAKGNFVRKMVKMK